MGYNDLSDEQLMTRVMRGDTTAFETLYDRYSSAVMGLALRITADHAAAEEIVQESFWRVWRKADSFQAQVGPFTNWLFSIARNLSVDLLRRRKMQARPSEALDEIMEQIPDPAPDVVEVASQGLNHQQMRAAIETLPNEQRDVIEMAYFRGMTRQEIAHTTGEPLGTIHTRARLALQKLREALHIHEFDE
jgi:RNA polymerase sigma-70 factor (ECF subfamily)